VTIKSAGNRMRFEEELECEFQVIYAQQRRMESRICT